jgi:hypothetical protein
VAGRFRLASNFVVDTNDYRGIGWCEESSAAEAVVVYRDLPGEIAEISRVPPSHLKPHPLPEETRVWVKNKGFGWWPGRAKAHLPDGNYRVKLAGIANLVSVPPWSIQVRWERPLEDPIAALRIGMTDTTRYYEARFGVMESLVRQREAARGYAAVLSAAVHPFHHQLGVMSRVLGDPVMRFVLADEVGLGKTIEAGLIARQLLLDDQAARIVVATPRHLEQQWREELRGKLLLGSSLRSGRVSVVEHASLVEGQVPGSTMLIIDEAHGLVEQTLGEPRDLARLTSACAASPGLLLLTATPLKGHAATFLGLLHLIDPVAYDLRDLERFEERFALRYEQASAIELLAPGVPSRMLRSVLADFRTRYGQDHALVTLIDAADATMDAEAGELGDALTAVSDYLRETYRISRRVIRNRRSAVVDEGFPVRGRLPVFVELQDPERENVDDFLDQWRQALLEAVSPEDKTAQAIFAAGVECTLGGSAAIRGFIAARSQQSFFSATEAALFAQQHAQLRHAQVSNRTMFVLKVVRDLLAEAMTKIVVFANSSGLIDELNQALRAEVDLDAVACHLVSMAPGEQDDSVHRFVHGSSCRILLCDASGEEGRNLQAATHVVHADLPLSINRLEQRLGRADRFSDGCSDRAQSLIIAEPNSVWVSTHLTLLNAGVGVLSGSVAALQRPLSELEERIRRELLERGVAAMAPELADLRAQLDDEREQIDLLEELEATQFDSELYGGAVDSLIEFDADSKPIEIAFDALTQAQGGVLLRKTADPRTPRVFSYAIDSRVGTVPFMAGDDVEAVTDLLPGRRTFDRGVATELGGVSPMRTGDQLVDWLDGYLRRDEGGRAWAVWRPVGDIDTPAAFFRVDLVLEFEEGALPQMPATAVRRLRRRGDAFLRPRVETVWLREGGGEVAPNVVDEQLDPATSDDQQLRGPLWIAALRHFPEWEARCATLQARALDVVSRRAEVVAWRESASAQVRLDLDRRSRVFASWIERLPSGHERDHANREYETELALDAAIRAGIESPRVFVLAAGAVLLARERLVA